MKKIMFGVFAVALAIAASAFTKPAHSTFATYYFPLDVNGNPVSITSLPPQSDTYGCLGGLTPCAAAYPSYTHSGSIYTASGTQIANTEDFKP
jgi:hypothetical protein